MNQDSNRNFESIRDNYNLGNLDVKSVSKDPLIQFEAWMSEAIKSEISEVTAMSLSTVDVNGKPSSRTVLLKKFNEDGFVFFTNYQSKKGNSIMANNNVALLFFWKELQRQIRIEGKAEQLSREESIAYFNSRPLESRIGAIISPQSMKVKSQDLKVKYDLFKEQKTEDEIECPENWGGYLVKPTLLEFWQGRPGRLHDRVQYELLESNEWAISCLAP